ncbi:unnamed protein product [Eruca vesicaria subsp. sativa]|uniref:Uncharacterized protein n=1 Tax=Eruca vesicaria subsp. sativa TaxID=29727 RepID=A0ABC8J6K2_ERUVS|nr:unnamed protein product [Eruca vesicaria subsp. sativa]
MGRTPCCDKAGLKKGPWTPEEDQKLLAYIEEHGHGSWRSLPDKAGLQRCGKSCRLRWTNYLRPDIKRGKFTVQEEQTIIQLHALLGNRWSAIATHLAKRTDNEIKNYWNTHLKKRLVKMGIDPVTHKQHKNNETTLIMSSTGGQSKSTLSHMAQWESARLEAEARLARESKKLLHYQNNKAAAPNHCLAHKASTNWRKPNALSSSTFSDVKDSDHDWMKQINCPTEGFMTSLLLLDDSVDRSLYTGKNAEETVEVNESEYSYYEENKNYWNSILNLVDSSPSDSSTMF